MDVVGGSNNALPQPVSTEPAAVTDQSQPALWVGGGDSLASYKLPGVHLGRILGPDGWAAGAKDHHQEVVPDAGIAVKVSQSSGGHTGVSAVPLEGYQVEALHLDASSPETLWRGPDFRGEVPVSSDSGILGDLDPGTPFDVPIGTAGDRYGIVRVTGPARDVRYFLLGAAFKGREDDWRVAGFLEEVLPAPNNQLVQPQAAKAIGSRAVDRIGADPTAAAGNVTRTVGVDMDMVSRLRKAFTHDTPDVDIHHAGEASAEAAGKYAHVALDAIIEAAKQQPELMQGTGELVDELGRRARLLNNSGDTSTRSFVEQVTDPDSMRIAYLESVRATISVVRPNQRNAHWHTLFASGAFDILDSVLASGGSINLAEDSALIAKITEAIDQDERETERRELVRAEILRQSVLDPERRDESTDMRTIDSDSKVILSLGGTEPLLTRDQTNAAFYEVGRTDAGSTYVTAPTDQTIAMIEHRGAVYAVLQPSKSIYALGVSRYKEGHSRTYNGPDDSQLRVLQVMPDGHDPRYGTRVLRQNFAFDVGNAAGILPVRDLTDRDEGGLLRPTADTGITVELDEESGSVTIAGTDEFKVITRVGSAEVARKNSIDRQSIEQRRHINSWRQQVRSVRRETQQLRSALEANLQHGIDNGWIKPEDVAARRQHIELEVARGPERSYTYNGYRGDKWHRAQPYNVSLDEDGNIWGDYHAVAPDYQVTGRPLPPGRRLVRRNPLPELGINDWENY